MSKDKYDFNFITLALGLIPVAQNRAAINPGAVVSITRDPDDNSALIAMHEADNLHLTAEDMAELEETIKRRGEEAKAIQKEAMRNQIVAQNEVINEINRGVQSAVITGAIPPALNKKGRH